MANRSYHSDTADQDDITYNKLGEKVNSHDYDQIKALGSDYTSTQTSKPGAGIHADSYPVQIGVYDSVSENSIEGDGNETSAHLAAPASNTNSRSEIKTYIEPMKATNSSVAKDVQPSRDQPVIPSSSPQPTTEQSPGVQSRNPDQLNQPAEQNSQRISPQLPRASTSGSEVNELYQMHKDVNRVQPNFEGYHVMSG